ncbi:choline transporter-like protein 1 [Perca fluviatilis]|uniref:choline transporter-like protein 1 n=1 Tax=Perca fluviatilis TaxID=8168 RepID=UPI00196591F9|nr:choline transporter-like protein 1 [Perca fluviatilis]
MGCCGSTERTKREWRPLEDRSCTDLPWFLLFTVFCVGMGSICGFSIVTGGAARLVFGYDSYGNTCGQRNEPIEGVRLSGLDHTDRKFVFFLDPCNIDIVQRKIRSLALCVSLCPSEELATYQDLKRFAMLNGSELCSYELAGHKYPGLPERFSKCPKLPVPPSKPLTSDPCSNKPLTSDPCSNPCRYVRIRYHVSAGLSMILMLIIRYISAVLVWILTSLVVLGSLAGTSVLWWLYIDHRLYGNTTVSMVTPPKLKEASGEEEAAATVAKDNGQALLVYAAAATVFTLILLLLMLFMRKRVALTVALFAVAGKVFVTLPLLSLQPFVTFGALLLFWSYWSLTLLFLGTTGQPHSPCSLIPPAPSRCCSWGPQVSLIPPALSFPLLPHSPCSHTLLFLGTTGNPVQNEETGLTEFRLTGPLQYLTWYHAVGLVWITEFILACQQMTVAGAVVTYYFTRDKNRLPVTPILSSVLRLVRYHLGTVAKGAFIITLVKIPRLILMYLHNQLKGKENACARCLLKTCICCLWCLEKCLNYLNQNAYAATAINSTSFCTSAHACLDPMRTLSIPHHQRYRDSVLSPWGRPSPRPLLGAEPIS